MPQILMLQSAASRNKQRLDAQLGQQRANRPPIGDAVDPPDDTPVFMGKSIEQLSSDEVLRYLNS